MTLRPLAAALALALAAASVTAPAPGRAADATGAYGARGAQGVMTCAQLQRVVAARGPELLALIAWIDGAVTGANMMLPNTFDLSPYRGSPVVQAMVIKRCGANPQSPVHAVLYQVLNTLAPFRSQTDGPMVAMSANGSNMAIAESAMRQVQQQLIERGFLPTRRVDGRYTEPVRKALREFQQANRLPLTELPDPETLERLGRR
ncbi:MAG: peptidoglycan-binding domain-containing protein [Pikeienuella sp.]|uniref:peptidoglycan-binding domain-containing protein n=1 Tax=Pikeienuella sp. TaxID=2831957 RepID=UPI00391B748E